MEFWHIYDTGAVAGRFPEPVLGAMSAAAVPAGLGAAPAGVAAVPGIAEAGAMPGTVGRAIIPFPVLGNGAPNLAEKARQEAEAARRELKHARRVNEAMSRSLLRSDATIESYK